LFHAYSPTPLGTHRFQRAGFDVSPSRRKAGTLEAMRTQGRGGYSVFCPSIRLFFTPSDASSFDRSTGLSFNNQQGVQL
jgi:hypothetical protein